MIKKYPWIFAAVLLMGIALIALLSRPVLALAEGEMPTPEENTPVEETALPEDTLPNETVEPEVQNPPEEEPVLEQPPAEGEPPIEPPLPEEVPLDEEVPSEEEQPTQEEETVTDETILEEQPAADESPQVTEDTAPEEEVLVTGSEETPETTVEGEPQETQPLLVETGTEPAQDAAVTDPEDVAQTTEIQVEPAVQSASPDPYIDRADGRYRFLPVGGCTAYGGVGPYCIESATPLQAAINAANDGEVINVEAGTYTEQVEVINTSLTLRGWGNPIIAAPGPLTAAGSIYALVYASNANLNIEGFVINGSSASDGDALTDNSIYSIYYLNSGGIISNNTILSNASTNDETYAVYVDNADGTPRDVIITNNNVNDYTEGGVHTQGSSLDATITYNTFTNTAPGGNDSTAIHVEGSPGNTISGNTITGNHNQGIEIQDFDSNSVTSNTIRDVSQNGIHLINSSGNMVILNVITHVDDYTDSSAIRIDQDSDGNYIAQNTLQNNSIAVLVLNGSDNTVITENRISGNETGVQMAADLGKDEPLNTTVYWNILTGNTTDIVNLTSTTLYASLNWWGCPQGTPVCGKTSGLVDTSSPLPYNPDPDYDMVFNNRDNCPFVYNPDQLDSNFDGIGDACDEDVRSYEIPFVEDEKDIETYPFTLSDNWDSELVLVKTLDSLEEIELAKVLYVKEIAPGGTQVSFEQVLEKTLPKPLENGVVYLGPAYTLAAASRDGKKLDELEKAMELRWLLPKVYQAPGGYRLAILFFDEDTFFWISEAWQELESELDAEDNTILTRSSLQGTYILVLVPEP